MLPLSFPSLLRPRWAGICRNFECLPPTDRNDMGRGDRGLQLSRGEYVGPPDRSEQARIDQAAFRDHVLFRCAESLWQTVLISNPREYVHLAASGWWSAHASRLRPARLGWRTTMLSSTRRTATCPTSIASRWTSPRAASSRPGGARASCYSLHSPCLFAGAAVSAQVPSHPPNDAFVCRLSTLFVDFPVINPTARRLFAPTPVLARFRTLTSLLILTAGLLRRHACCRNRG